MIRADGAAAVMVVADGCSSGARSEVGAQLIARTVAELAWARFIANPGQGPQARATGGEGGRPPSAKTNPGQGPEADPFEGSAAGPQARATGGEGGRPPSAKTASLSPGSMEAAERLAKSIGPAAETILERLLPSRDRLSFVRDYLLATFLAAVCVDDVAIVFGVGDGMYAVDGVVERLDPGPGNAPAYLAYGVAGREPGGEGLPSPAVEVHFAGKASSVAIGTDGADDLEPEQLRALCEDPRLSVNPSLLQKALRALALRDATLRDDTTLAVTRLMGGGR